MLCNMKKLLIRHQCPWFILREHSKQACLDSRPRSSAAKVSTCAPQFLNFSFVPLYMRTTYTGCCAFVWAIFMCFSQQRGDGTASAALALIFSPKDKESEPEERKVHTEVKGVALKEEAVKSPQNWNIYFFFKFQSNTDRILHPTETC